MSKLFKQKYFKLISILTFFPIFSFAQYTGTTSRLTQLILSFGGLLNFFVSIIFALAMIYFFWNTANFILKDASNEKTRKEGLKRIVWGVIVLFVFVSIWGILNLMQRLINI